MGGRGKRHGVTSARVQQPWRRNRTLRLAGVITVVVGAILAAWLAVDRPDVRLPAYTRANPLVAEAYRFALSHRDLLAQIPCTCGCDAIGHRSNADCYIKAIREQRVVWDPHGAG